MTRDELTRLRLAARHLEQALADFAEALAGATPEQVIDTSDFSEPSGSYEIVYPEDMGFEVIPPAPAPEINAGDLFSMPTQVCDECGGRGGWMSPADNADIEACWTCDGTGRA